MVFIKVLIHPVIYYINKRLHVPGYMLSTIPLQPVLHLLLCHHRGDIGEGFFRQGRSQVTDDHELVLRIRWQRVEALRSIPSSVLLASGHRSQCFALELDSGPLSHLLGQHPPICI